MDIKQIHYFKAVADCGSFAKASERLHISQPAISAQINQLEIELGAELLTRHARGARLTAAGSVFLVHVRDILARLEQARAAVQDLTNEISGSVTIAMITTIANIVTPPLLERAKRLYPKLDIRVFEALSGEISAWHASDRFDLSIMYLPDNHSLPDATPFVEEQLYLLGPPARRKKSEATIRFDELRDLPIHHTSRIHACRLLLDRTSSDRRVDLNIVAEIDSITLLYEFAAKRGAYTIFPSLGEPPIFQREVDYRQIVDPDLSLKSYIVSGANRPRSKAVASVVSLLSDISNEIANPETRLELQFPD